MPQKPIRRATERNEAAIPAWMAQEYPTIVKRVKQAKAEIHWSDGTGLSSQAHDGRSFASEGQKFVDDQWLSNRSNIACGSRPAK